MALPAQVTNLVKNPSSEVAVALTNLSNCTATRESTAPYSGSWQTRLSATAAGTLFATTPTAAADRFPVTVGATYVASAHVKRNGATARTGSIRMSFYTSAGAFISTGGAADTFTYTTTYQRVSQNIVAPATAASAVVFVGVTSAAAAETFDVDAISATAGTTLEPYFDGSTTEANYTHAWTGTAHASTSTRDVYGVWPEQSAESGAPKVQVTAIGLGSTSVTTQIIRESGGESWTVPGWKKRNTLGGATFTDFAPPLGRPVTYTLLVNGSAVSSRTITVASTQGWVSSPIQPELAMPIALDGSNPNQLSLAKPSLKDYKYSSRGDEEYPMGGRYPVARSAPRGGAEGVQFVMYARTDAVSDEFQRLMAASPILLFRGLPTWGSLPPLSYIKGDVVENPFNRDVGQGFTQWTAEGRLVAPVATAPVSGSVTNQMVADNLTGRTHASIAAASGNKRNIDIAANPLGLGS